MSNPRYKRSTRSTRDCPPALSNARSRGDTKAGSGQRRIRRPGAASGTGKIGKAPRPSTYGTPPQSFAKQYIR